MLHVFLASCVVMNDEQKLSRIVHALCVRMYRKEKHVWAYVWKVQGKAEALMHEVKAREKELFVKDQELQRLRQAFEHINVGERGATSPSSQAWLQGTAYIQIHECM
jgi:hypothetical protein